MADVTFTIAIQDDGTPVIRNIKREVEGLGTAGQQAGKKAGEGLTAMDRAAASFARTLAGISAIVLAKQLISMADTATLLSGRLKLVTSSHQELVQVQDALFQSAQRTRSQYEGTVDLYTRLARNSKELGASQKDLLQVTESINKTLIISGTTGASANAALVQLGQAFASGTLRGEELNSILEQTPRLAEAIAKGMGVTIGQLRQLGLEGKLTAEAVFDAIKSQGEIIDSEFGKLPTTVGQALTQLGNSMLQFVDTINQASSATSALVRALDYARFATEFWTEALRKNTAAETFRETTREIERLEEKLTSLKSQGPISFFGMDVKKGWVALSGDITKTEEELTRLRKTAQDFAAETKGFKFWIEPDALFKVSESFGVLLSNMGPVTKEQEKFEKSTRAQIDALTKHAETMNLSGAALAEWHKKQTLASAGAMAGSKEIKELADQVYKAVLADEASKASKEAATKATQAKTKADRDAITETKKLAREREKLAKDLAKEEEQNAENILKIANALREEAKVRAERLDHMQEEVTQLEEESRLLLASLGPRETLLALEKEIATARSKRATASELAKAAEEGLGKAEQDLILRAGELREKNIDLADSTEQHRLALQNAILTVNDAKDAFSDFITEALDDPGKALKSIEDYGKQLGGKLIAGIAFGKKGLEDDVLIPNFSDVFGPNGIVGRIFGQGGQSAGGDWVTGFSQTLSSYFGSSSADFGNVLGGGSSTAAGGAAGSGWGQGFIQSASSLFNASGSSGGGQGIFSKVTGGGSSTAAAGTAAGSAYGDAFGYAAIAGMAIGAGKDFAKGKYGSGGGAIVGGAIAGYFSAGNPQAIALGAMIGKWLGSFLDPLFKHIKTKGSQIRANVKDFFKEIEVSFAKEIDSTEYFFPQTKKLADKMFGGDFLAASKKVLTDKIGPELAKQLQALGTAITADMAIKEGKSLEQTGTTFGNMLVKNLGIEAIPDAIAEVISKGDFTFENLTDKLTEVFDKKKVSAEFYIDTIQGAVDIFYGDLPEAIHVSELAMQSFDETGKFVLETFTGLVDAAMARVDAFSQAVGQALADGIASGQTRAQVEASFEQLFKDGLRAALVKQVATDTITDLLKNFDLSKPIDLSSDAFVKLKGKVGDAYDQLMALLDAAGLLPDVLNGSVDSADNLVGKIRELQSAIREIANQRIELRLELLDDFVSIGLITALDAIAERMQTIQDRITALYATANANAPGRRHEGEQRLSDLSDADLNQLLILQSQLRQAILSRYQEEATAIQTASQAQISAIRADYAARREAIQSDFSARRAAIQADSSARQEAIRADFDARKKAIQADFDARKEAIRADFDARKEAIQTDFKARKEAVQETISQLQEQRNVTQELYQEQIQGLQDQLQIAEQFGQVVQSITEMIRAAALSVQSPLAPQQQLGFLQREEAGVRGQLSTATGAERVRLTQDLARILQQQLQFVDRNTVNGQQLFRGIIVELKTLRDEAADEADKAANLQARIAQANLAMEAALKSIDEQIQQQQDLLSSLSEQEQDQLEALSQQEQAALNALSQREQAALEALSRQEQAQLNAISQQEQSQLDALASEEKALLTALAAQEESAIAAVEAAATAQLEALRKETAEELTALAVQQDLALQEQLKRLEAQLETAKEQLIAQVGVERATELLAAGDEANLILLAQANVTLLSINDNILRALNDSQDNNQSDSQNNSEFASESNNNQLSASLFGSQNSQQNSNSSQGFISSAVPLLYAPQQSNATAPPPSNAVNISFSPVVNVSVDPGEEGRVKQSMEEVMRLAEQRFGRKLETDWAPKIRRIAEGKI